MCRQIFVTIKKLIKLTLQWGCVAIVSVVLAFTLLSGEMLALHIVKELISDVRVEKDYGACVGLSPETELDFASLQEEYGKPDGLKIFETDEKNGNSRMYVRYGGLTYLYHGDDESGLWELDSIISTDPEHYFGPRRIHVGSTREEVRRAYWRMTHDASLPLGSCYYDKSWDEAVFFTYDENDIVTSIRFIEGM